MTADLTVRSCLYAQFVTVAAAQGRYEKSAIKTHSKAARRSDDDVRTACQLARLLMHVQAAHNHHILERHAGAQCAELLRQLECQLPAG